MTPAEKRRRHVLATIEMFASLGLPVCDDEEAIKAKCDEQRAARNRELNSTKGSLAAKAQKWFDNADALLHRREALLGVVYDEWAALCEATLRACLDSGQTLIGADTQLSLRDLAVSWCRVRPDLSNHWLAVFLEQRGLAVGGVISKAKLVGNLSLKRGRRKVALRWTTPAEACDSVRILRSSDPPGAEEDDQVVFEGKAERFKDTSVEPKAHYIYRVFTVLGERESLTSAVARTRVDASKAGTSWVQALVAGVLVTGLAVLGWLHGPDLLDRLIAGSTAEARSDGADGGGQPAADPERDPERDSGPADGEPRDDDTEPGATSAASTPRSGTERGTIRTGGLDPHVTRTSTGVIDTEPAAGEPPEPVQQPDEDDAPDPQSSAPQGPTASLREPPSLAFSGSTLRLELGLTGDVLPQLVETDLEGLAFKRSEFDVSPPAVVFDVLPLPEDTDSIRARWSFRFADAQGQLTEPVVGSCVVLPGD